MNRQEAEQFAVTQLDQHGLTSKGWTFSIVDRATRKTLGTCHYRSKRIVLTGWYVDLNGAKEVHDTILHEIAHALAGASAGHGPAWKQMAESIGAQPNRLRLTSSIVRMTGKYKAVCQVCQHVFHRDGVTRRGYMCPCTKSHPIRPYLEFVRTRSSVIGPAHAVAAQSIAPASSDVEYLLDELAKSSGPQARRIRAKLRRLGHKGGLR